MELTDVQRRILNATILRANVPESEIARSLGIREHSVRRTIKMFLDKGIFFRRAVYINPYALGLMLHVLRISLPPESLAERESLFKILSSSEQVGSIAELAGGSHLEIRVYSRSSGHLSKFIEELARSFRLPFKIQDCLCVVEQEYSGTRHTGVADGESPIFSYTAPILPSNPTKLEEKDHLIISSLSNDSYRTLNEVARKLAIPYSSLVYRISAMETAGIILGHYYIVDIKNVGQIPVCFTLESKILSPDEKRALKLFCRKHPSIAWMSFFLGGRTAELLARVSSYAEGQSLLTELSKQFKGMISNIVLLPQVNFSKHSRYPFRSYKAFNCQ